MNYGYIRVSTDRQTVENQRFAAQLHTSSSPAANGVNLTYAH